jgi:exopolysaccharide biosynthesis polyprenyl glycosylphosphotransferase
MTVNRKPEISKDLSMIFDGLILGLCLWLSYQLRISGIVVFDGLQEIPPFSHSYWILAVVIAIGPLLLDFQGFYDNTLTQRYERDFLMLGKAGFWLFLILSAASVFGKLEIPSRSVMILFLLICPLFLIFRVLVTKKLLVHYLKEGKSSERSVVVGSHADIASFTAGLNPMDKVTLQIARQFDLEILDAETIKKSIRTLGPDRVIFVSPDSPLNKDLPFEFESEGLEIWMLAQNIKGMGGFATLQSIGKNRVIVFRNSSSDFWYHFTKRLLDIIVASVGILLFLPVGVFIAAAIKLTSPGPVIFRQVRSGKRGRRFTILKFRSMVVNAPELHAKLAEQNEMKGPTFKIKKDPRVTHVGEFIRRTSLDELPQLLNVLRGDMSIVGPRPLPDYETERIEKGTHRRRLSVHPGLTCLWQIRGRSSISSFEDWVQLDIEYIDNASLLLDLWIILQTIPSVLFSKGAH